jgi:hypothetical protein
MLLQRTVAMVKTPVHLAKQYIHRRVDPSYRVNFVQGDEKARAQAVAEDFKRDGIVIIPSYFQGENLKQLCAAFERVTAGKGNPDSPDSLWTNDILLNEPAMLEAALDSFLLEVMGLYFHRKFGISTATANRLDPTPSHRDGSYQWHHDARSKQINFMILLSTVSARGQRMSYLRQSHLRYYDYYNGIIDTHTKFNNEVDNDQALQDKIVEVVGPAGTVALFDSNGLHSGNRNDVERRDSVIINYASRRHFKNVRLNKRDFLALPSAKQEILALNPKLELVD